jgi:hypothetical protein
MSHNATRCLALNPQPSTLNHHPIYGVFTPYPSAWAMLVLCSIVIRPGMEAGRVALY